MSNERCVYLSVNNSVRQVKSARAFLDKFSIAQSVITAEPCDFVKTYCAEKGLVYMVVKQEDLVASEWLIDYALVVSNSFEASAAIKLLSDKGKQIMILVLPR